MLAVQENESFDLADLLAGAVLRSVPATPAVVAGRRALRVSLTDEVTLEGRAGIDYVDMPTFVRLGALSWSRNASAADQSVPSTGVVGDDLIAQITTSSECRYRWLRAPATRSNAK